MRLNFAPPLGLSPGDEAAGAFASIGSSKCFHFIRSSAMSLRSPRSQRRPQEHWLASPLAPPSPGLPEITEAVQVRVPPGAGRVVVQLYDVAISPCGCRPSRRPRPRRRRSRHRRHRRRHRRHRRHRRPELTLGPEDRRKIFPRTAHNGSCWQDPRFVRHFRTR